MKSKLKKFFHLKSFINKKLKLLVMTLAVMPSLAMADPSGSNALSSVLSGLIKLLQSTPARLLFVVAIIGIGYGTLALGKIPKERAVAIIIGIGIVFGASYIAQQMGMTG